MRKMMRILMVVVILLMVITLIALVGSLLTGWMPEGINRTDYTFCCLVTTLMGLLIIAGFAIMTDASR